MGTLSMIPATVCRVTGRLSAGRWLVLLSATAFPTGLFVAPRVLAQDDGSNVIARPFEGGQDGEAQLTDPTSPDVQSVGADTEANDRQLEESSFDALFASRVLPFIQQYCSDCHGSVEPEAKLDLSPFRTVDAVTRQFELWQLVLERVEAGEMPPSDAVARPSDAERESVVDWIRAVRAAEAKKRAGDPGHVPPRRLNAAEYNYTIHDLTGVDLRPAKEFPIDPANEAGFDNSAESLMMTPGLLSKYLDAAHEVASHLLFTPAGLRFAEFPVLSDTDRDKFAVRQIIDFYEKQNTHLSDYFLAAWQYRNQRQHRNSRANSIAVDSAIDLSGASTSEDSDAAREQNDTFSALRTVAEQRGLSSRYLRTLWLTLQESSADTGGSVSPEADSAEMPGPLATVRRLWRELPDVTAPVGQDDALGATLAEASAVPEAVRKGCDQLQEYITTARDRLTFEFPVLSGRGISSGSQSLILYRNRQYATHRMQLNRDALHEPSPANPADADQLPAGSAPTGSTEQAVNTDLFSLAQQVEQDLLLPSEDTRPAFIAECEQFCRVFPDAFYVAQRGREFIKREQADLDEEKKVRLLSAGFHSMLGYFRDDAPLYELMLDDRQQQQLDQLWRELDFISAAPIRQHAGYIWYERAESRFLISEEFDFVRSEDRESTTEENLQRLASLYLAKAERNGASQEVLQAVREHFVNTNTNIRWLEAARQQAEPLHVDSLVELAHRAFRRPLTQAEDADIRSFYRTLRERDGLPHEDAVRDVLVSVLMSPYFCYTSQGPMKGVRREATLSNPSDASAAGLTTEAAERGETSAGQRHSEPLDDYALASRLSYFLWSSMPDDELLSHAAAGDLCEPAVLREQTTRMLRDDRIQRFATEFGGHWLDFRQFQKHNSVDRGRFPAFDDTLREAMFQEPVRFLTHVIQQDQSVLDCLFGDYTFVNQVLATHYGIPSSESTGEESSSQTTWRRVAGANALGRGGLLPMAVFLTKNSPGLRTSPVKRGYWVVRQLLGERIPPPPPGVPELPSDESQLGDLTLRDLLASHREHQSCAVCHSRFDSMGLVFEGFGPVGEQRQLDLGGRPVQTVADWPDGTEGSGVAGLRDYLLRQRQADFVDNLCRKLLAYGLGRTLSLSDDAVLLTMREQLELNHYHFNSLVHVIVSSPQFLRRRVDSFVFQEPNHEPTK